MHVKIPFAQTALLYGIAFLNSTASAELPLVDQNIIVDTYARYRIVDPLEFYKTVRTEIDLRDRLDEF